ncbi:MAG: lactonase family protein [Actinomycetota bacterium]|nr:lactonase family protein [Actinomycetota bacterium]
MAASEVYVAGRGDAVDPTGGLFLFRENATGWVGSRLAAVPELSALARHPELAVVYGTSSGDGAGRLHAWRIDGDRAAEPLSQVGSGGAEPCHVCVDPTGGALIACNYAAGVLGCWTLTADGAIGPARLMLLQGNGSGKVPARQDRPHPHQAQFLGDRLLVTDLGADCLRQFSIDTRDGGLVEVARYPSPPGGGPRHLVNTAAGGVAASMELSGELAVSSSDLSHWHTAASTMRSGPASSRSTVNYPGDLQRSADGKIGYLGNRGYDTIAAFALDETPRLLVEVDAGVRWPQHLLVDGDRLLVAGQDSSRVVGLPLDAAGLPGRPEPLFDCPGACWLLPAG